MKIDKKECKNNRFLTRLDDYSTEKLLLLCTFENKKPSSLIRKAVLQYINENLIKELGGE